MMLRSFVISLCLAGLAVAQTTPAPGGAARLRGRGPGGRGPGGRGPAGPAGLTGPNAEARLTRQLGLDATQQNTLHSALESSRVQQQGMSQKMADLRMQLATAVKAGDESGIDRISQDISNLHQQQTAIHAKTLSKVYTALKPDQQAKINALMNREMGLPAQPAQRRPAAGRGARLGRRAPAAGAQQ